MADKMSTADLDDEVAGIVADRLGAIVTQELPCDPNPGAVAAWVAHCIESGFTRVFAVNVESCVGPQCALALLAELDRHGADAGDREFVARALADPGSNNLLRHGSLAQVLTNALHAPADAVLRQVMAAAREGVTSHARCVRLGHEVVILFDHHAKLDWLFSGAKHKVRDALAKVGCDHRAALTQDVELAQGGKLSLPGYEVAVTRRRGKLHAEVKSQGVESGHAPVTSPKPESPTPEPIRRQWPTPAFGFVGHVVRAVGAPVRVLSRVELSPRNLSAFPAAALEYARSHKAALAVVIYVMTALTCVSVVVADVYGTLSGETAAPQRPPGFYVVQYNRAGPWGRDLRPYGLYVPPHVRGRPGPFPLVVYLHGWGERTPGKLFAAGLPMSIASRFGERGRSGRFEFVALFLHDPTGFWIADTTEGMEAIEVLDYVMARHRIDPRRVYLTGASSGGAGVWHLAEAYPDRWAAVAPLGAVDTPRPDQVRHIPTWVFHGGRDEVALIQTQRDLVKTLREAGADVRFTEFAGKGHTVSSETYDTRELFDWFATKTR